MTAPVGARRWRDRAQRSLLALAFAATVGTLVLVGVNAALLGQMTNQVQAAGAQTAALNNSSREMLRLEQRLIELGEETGPDDVDIQRGVVGRQLLVTVAAYPAGSAEAVELDSIWHAIKAFPWSRLPAHGGHASPLRAEGMARLDMLEKRLNAVRSAEEKRFYTTTLASLAAKRRSQMALVLLVSVVLILGTTTVLSLVRRRRGDIARAYEALKVQMHQRRALEDELTRQAHHDSLTGLANRALFLKSLEAALADPDPQRPDVSVVLIDLDGFKDVNDSHGHVAGDELLQLAAQRLRECIRTDDVAARLGGDEFALLLTGGSRNDDAVVAHRVVDALRQPVFLQDRNVRIGASAGLAYAGRRDSAQDLLRDADIAMYVAKDSGKGHVEVFESSMRVRSAQRAILQQDVARAAELRQIEVHYQPIIDLSTQRITSLEALARWNHPRRGVVAPDTFIPVAELSGAIIDIGRDVLLQACSAVQGWRTTTPGHEDLGVTVNVSVRQLVSGQLVDHVQEALTASGLPPTALTLELTESAMLEVSEPVSAELNRLKVLGVKIAVDDFGSGYSSLGFLLTLDADILKIDRTLLDFDTAQDGSLVKAVTELGRTLGLTVVVEGVETTENLAMARAAHCDAAQGYLFSRPLQASAIPACLAKTAGALVS